MKIKLKKNILIILVLLIYIFTGIKYFNGLFDNIDTFISIFIGLIIMLFVKRKKNLYALSLPFSLYSFIYQSFSIYLFSFIGLIISLIKSKEEQNISIIIKKHTIFYAIVFGIVGISFLNYSSLVGAVWELENGPHMIVELLACIFLFILIKLGRKTNMLKSKMVPFKEAFMVSLPFFSILAIVFVSQFFMNYKMYEFNDAIEIICFILGYLLVGIFEDVLVRGLVLNIMLDKYGNNKRGIWLSIIISSLIFGCAHFLNLTTGAEFNGVLIQVIAASGIGIYLAAIYLRTNSVWYVALLHGLWDIAATSTSLFKDTNVDLVDTISNYSIINLYPVIVYILLAIYLLRKRKIKEVIACRNNLEIEKDSKNYSFRNFSYTMGCLLVVFIIFSMSVSYTTINNNMIETYKNLPNDFYFQYEENFLYNKDLEFNKLDDNTKMVIALKNHIEYDKLINKNDIDSYYKKLYGTSPKTYPTIYVDPYITCTYDNGYTCTNNSDNKENDYMIYTGIKGCQYDGNEAALYIYYLYVDTNENIIYADSGKNIELYHGSIKTITNKKYDESDLYNKKFFNEINKVIDVPVYKYTFNVNTFNADTTLNNIKMDNIDKLNIKFDKEYKDIKLEYLNKRIVITYLDTIMEIKEIDLDKYLEKYRNTEEILLGNNKYYYNRLEDIYLIKDQSYKYGNCYEITIDSEENNKTHAYEILSSLKL